MKFKSNQKYNTIAIYSVAVFTICLILVAVVFKYSSFSKYVGIVAEVFAPIIWGIVITFLLNPVMMFFERHIGKVLNRKKPHPKLLRFISVILSLALLLTIIASLVANIIPQIIESVKSIFTNMDSYLDSGQQWVDKRIEENDFLKSIVEGEIISIRHYIVDFVSKWQKKIDLLPSIAERGISILTALKDFILGLILAVYMLLSKETFFSQGKKMMYALMPVDRCNTFIRIMRRVNRIFTRYLSGMLLDSFIVGLITFAVLTFAGIPYVVLISLIIGVTNMIPFFGPFIGAVPSALLIFFVKPEMTIFFVIFIVILQQLDGNFLAPAILGDSLGISPFWIVVALLISGGLFGFIGMVMAVPVFAVFYALAKEIAESKLRKKSLPTESSQYRGHGNIEIVVSQKNKTDCNQENDSMNDNITDAEVSKE